MECLFLTQEQERRFPLSKPSRASLPVRWNIQTLIQPHAHLQRANSTTSIPRLRLHPHGSDDKISASTCADKGSADAGSSAIAANATPQPWPSPTTRTPSGVPAAEPRRPHEFSKLPTDSDAQPCLVLRRGPPSLAESALCRRGQLDFNQHFAIAVARDAYCVARFKAPSVRKTMRGSKVPSQRLHEQTDQDIRAFAANRKH